MVFFYLHSAEIQTATNRIEFRLNSPRAIVTSVLVRLRICAKGVYLPFRKSETFQIAGD